MILDVCCGGRMFYFNKQNENVVYCDKIKECHEFPGNRKIDINPDVISDFSHLPFKSNLFDLVIFDPPHLLKAGDNSWLKKKYGRLEPRWQTKIKLGFNECIRVLRPGGTLIFKWNDTDVKIPEILSLFSQIPLLGHRTTKNLKTHWIVFYKGEERNEQKRNKAKTKRT